MFLSSLFLILILRLSRNLSQYTPRVLNALSLSLSLECEKKMPDVDFLFLSFDFEICNERSKRMDEWLIHVRGELGAWRGCV